MDDSSGEMAGGGRHRFQMGSGLDKKNCAFQDRCRNIGI